MPERCWLRVKGDDGRTKCQCCQQREAWPGQREDSSFVCMVWVKACSRSVAEAGSSKDRHFRMGLGERVVSVAVERGALDSELWLDLFT